MGRWGSPYTSSIIVLTCNSWLEPDLAKPTIVGLARVPFGGVAPIQAEAIRGCTFLNSVATRTKSSLAAAIVNRSEPCQCLLASSGIALTKIAGNVWFDSSVRRCTWNLGILLCRSTNWAQFVIRTASFDALVDDTEAPTNLPLDASVDFTYAA